MTKVYRYYDAAGAWNVDLGTSVVRLGSETGYGSTAEAAGVAGATVVFDDPAGTLGHASDGITGWKQFAVDELACPSGSQRLATYWIGSRRYSVGSGDSLITGPARKIEAALLDLNASLNLIKITGSDGDRPAETPSARLTWLTGSAYLSGLVADNGLVVAGGTDLMDANDYRRQTPGDVIGDCALFEHKNFFVYWDEAAADAALWYDDPITSATLLSTGRLTNYLADVDGATTFAAADVVLTRDPERVGSDVITSYDGGGWVLQTNSTTATTYTKRSLEAPNANTHTAATATAAGALLLADAASEDDRISCIVDIPAQYVTLFRTGYLIQGRFRHLTFAAPGADYSDWSWFRILRASPAQAKETDERYVIDMELSPATPDFGVATFTDARLMRPTWFGLVPDGPDGRVDGSRGDFWWAHNGDSPQGGDGNYPLVGAIAYVGTLPNQTGLKVTGAGSITIVLAFSAIEVVGPTHTYTASIQKNGIDIPGAVWTNTSIDTGLRNHVWNAESGDSGVLTTTTTVAVNDIISAHFISDPSGIESVLTPTIPAGTGSGEDQLRVYGTLIV